MIVYSIKITLLLWGPTKKGRAIALAFVYDDLTVTVSNH
jgi:hypothetical protein